MLKIGLTGNIASGKSTVESILQELGIKVLDADKVTHSLLAENKAIKNKVIALFDDLNILDENGNISRKKLGKIVFSNENKRKELEKILHPEIKQEFLRFFEENKNQKIVVVSAALLFEANMQSMFDKIILVTADNTTRLNRLIERNCISLEEAQKIIDTQMSQEQKIALADYVVPNNTTIDDLLVCVEMFMREI